MEGDSELLQETPDMDFSENAMEEETPDIHFHNIHEMETPDLDFSENAHADSNDKIQERFGVDESEIDDMDEPDQYVEDDDYGGGDDDVDDDGTKNDSTTNENSESVFSRRNKSESKTKDTATDNRLVQLPTARVKHIMKADPDVTLITGECTFLVAKATELFIESLAREAFLHTAQSKKKTVQKRDVDAAIENVESLTFLEGMMNF